MQLENTFTVPGAADDTFATFLDIERVATCLPGASLDTVEGDDFTGSVKVKLGPIALMYKGSATLVEKDPVARRMVLQASGRDARGNGTASARVTAQLSSEDEQVTRVDVTTELDITGRPAQFGRGVIADVAGKLIGQFADTLAAMLTEAGAGRAAGQLADQPVAPTPAGPTPVSGGAPPAAPADAPAIPLLRVVGPAVAKRALPVALVAVLALLICRRSRRRAS
jgi:carbon monoxide dehydrogenase subunit G